MRDVLVIGGGLAGISAAYALARSGSAVVTLVERGPSLGGLAGGFEIDGRTYPLGYHHILHRDSTLLFFLERIGALARVRWRRVSMLFEAEDGELYDFARVGDLARFPMPWTRKARFAFAMLRAFGRDDWSAWEGRSASALLDSWAGPEVRRALFEPMTRLKFQLPCDEVSAAWLGARLSYREGSAPLGYIPETTWTQVLCDGLRGLLEEAGVVVQLDAAAVAASCDRGRLSEIELSDGRRLTTDLVVSAVPTEVYCRLVPKDETPRLGSIRYTALISAVCATRQELPKDFYWLNLASLRRSASGLFVLSSLNPSLGSPGDTCLNFVTHLLTRDASLYDASDEEILDFYRRDFQSLFGFELEPYWSHVSRVPLYSPVFRTDYRNPPLRSSTYGNVFFTGTYRTFPGVASTGTALASGLESARAVLQDLGGETELPELAARFKTRLSPRDR